MTDPRRIAVIDVGKTNAKLALVDAGSLEELAVVTRPNRVLPGPPWPHFDLEAHWAFFLEHLSAFHAEHGIDAISITTHGASAVLLTEDGTLAAPMLDYEHDGPEALAAEYDALRPPFSETGSPRLPHGLNVGAQLHWQLATDPGLRAPTHRIVTYPQYWAFRLTGRFATDVTSLGCHTDLWNPWEGRFSGLVERLGIADKLAPARRSSDILGTITAEIAAMTGLSPETPVVCGIHDSNASLYPHLLGRRGSFAVVSTGTWVVVMAVDGAQAELDPARDVLVNVNARGGAVPSARFMGGREYDLVRDGRDARPGPADREAVLRGVYLLPSVVRDSGPYRGYPAHWSREPASDGERMLALSYYLALMTDTCLGLAGARGPVICEGPFARNADYLEMLAVLRPDGVEAATSATGTSVGSALLLLRDADPPRTRRITPANSDPLERYAAEWRKKVRAQERGAADALPSAP
jgi:sugar (pentulose or hexulose) kinase